MIREETDTTKNRIFLNIKYWFEKQRISKNIVTKIKTSKNESKGRLNIVGKKISKWEDSSEIQSPERVESVLVRGVNNRM